VLQEVHGCNGNAELEVEGQEVLPEGGRQLRGKERQRVLSEGKRQLLGKRRSVMLPGRLHKLFEGSVGGTWGGASRERRLLPMKAKAI
jgi:hypothetical protein